MGTSGLYRVPYTSETFISGYSCLVWSGPSTWDSIPKACNQFSISNAVQPFRSWSLVGSSFQSVTATALSYHHSFKKKRINASPFTVLGQHPSPNEGVQCKTILSKRKKGDKRPPAIVLDRLSMADRSMAPSGAIVLEGTGRSTTLPSVCRRLYSSRRSLVEATKRPPLTR